MPVEIDLYKDDLPSFGDPELFEAVEAFTRVKLPANDRTQEGYLVDFKATWSVSALQTVAAFANTFGGLLLVGVSDTNGRADQIVGIVSQRQELKTSIASSIASNISPTPPYEIRDVAFPRDPARHLRARPKRKQSLSADPERVAASLYPQRGREPACRCRPASGTAGDTRRLRPSAYRSLAVPAILDWRAWPLRHLREGRVPGGTAFPLGNLPTDHSAAGGASFTETRLRDWYQLTYLEGIRDYEIRWGIDSRGSVYFVTQVRCKVQEQVAREVWSLCDLMTNLDCTIEAAHQFWEYLNYPGEGRVLAELHVESLQILTRSGGMQAVYASAFYERNTGRKRAKPLSTGALVKTVQQGSRATAAVDLATRFGYHAEPVALLTNELLRDLGYAASLADLRALL